MTQENVISPAAFAGRGSRIDAEKIEELTSNGLLRKDAPAFDTIEVEELKYGETVLGTMSEEETLLFVNLIQASDEYEDANRDGASKQLIGMGEAVRDKQENFELSEKLGEDFFTELFKAQRRAEALKGLLFWYLTSRFDCHDHQIAIRTNRRVVKGARKW